MSSKTVAGIIFLYAISPGVADGSFGIEVAKLANIPPAIINRAYELVSQFSLPTGQQFVAVIKNEPNVDNATQKIAHFSVVLPNQSHGDYRIAELLNTIDYDNLSPKKAFDLLWQIKNIQEK
jgi:DNA mismatch repair protein MutS